MPVLPVGAGLTTPLARTTKQSISAETIFSVFLDRVRRRRRRSDKADLKQFTTKRVLFVETSFANQSHQSQLMCVGDRCLRRRLLFLRYRRCGGGLCGGAAAAGRGGDGGGGGAVVAALMT